VVALHPSGVKRRLLHLLLVLSTVLAGCSPSARVRYRVTVEVDDHGLIRSGSGVWSFALREAWLPLVSAYDPHFLGEAFPVELPGRGTIFVLPLGRVAAGPVRQGFVEMYPEHLFEPEFPGNDRVSELRRIATEVGRSIQLSCSAEEKYTCPALFRFKDITDPTSIQALDSSNLGETFGPSVSLRRVVVQITNDNPSFGVKARLPYRDNDPEFVRWLNGLDFRDVRRVSRSDFVRN